MLLIAAGAAADDFFPAGLMAEDQDLLARFDEIRAAATAGATPAGRPEDVDVLAQVLVGAPMARTVEEIIGQWACRFIDVNGGTFLPGVTVYPFFRCRIVPYMGRLELEKLSGSALFRGTLHDLGEIRFGYAGAGFGEDNLPLEYGASPGVSSAGYLIPLAPRRMRLEIPYGDAHLTILEFRRFDPYRDDLPD